jgi:hypothetical protein
MEASFDQGSARVDPATDTAFVQLAGGGEGNQGPAGLGSVQFLERRLEGAELFSAHEVFPICGAYACGAAQR